MLIRWLHQKPTDLHLQCCQQKEEIMPGHVAQSVTWLAADLHLSADPGVGSLILALSNTFEEIGHRGDWS